MIREAAVLFILTCALLAADPALLSLHDLNGKPQTLDQYRGHVVVVNFWATWCIPCREEMPLLVSIQKRYEAQGVVVLGAAADDETTQAQIPPFIQKLKIPFPIWTGATTEHMQRLGLGTGLPATAVIAPDGRIAFRILGIVEHKAITQRLDWLLTGGIGPSPEPLIDQISVAAKDVRGHEHGKEEHTHGGVGMEGASTVPS
jgi:thiol-disulfide isomerase/thioredoxin